MSYIKKFLEENSVGGDHGCHSVYWVNLTSFNELNIKRWKYNRPADQDRVKAIHEYMKLSKRTDGIIYLALVDHELVCYDGNHRREAIKGIAELTPILLDVLWEADDKIVGEEFKRLNEAVSVPEYYNSIEADNAVRENIRNAIDMFCKNYKDHKVNSKNPHRPNFNRDVFCDDFYRIMTENNIGVEELMNKLTRLNQEMMNRDKSDLPEKVISKCEKSGLWLFAWSSRLNSIEIV